MSGERHRITWATAHLDIVVRGMKSEIEISHDAAKFPPFTYRVTHASGEEVSDQENTFHAAYMAACRAAEGMTPLRRNEA